MSEQLQWYLGPRQPSGPPPREAAQPLAEVWGLFSSC